MAIECRASIERVSMESPNALEMLCGHAMHGLPIDMPSLVRFVTEHDVLAHGEVGAQVDLLVHG